MNVTNPVLSDILRVRPNFQPAIVFSIGTHLDHGAREFRAAFPAAEIFSFDRALDPQQASLGSVGNDSKLRTFRIALAGTRTSPELGGDGDDVLTAAAAAAAPSDSFCRDQGVERIDFLKLDTAGNDLEILKGLGGFLESGLVEFIQTECAFSPEDRIHTPYAAMAEFLFPYGYRLFGFFNHSTRDVAAATMRNGIQHGTVVFVIDRTVKRPVVAVAQRPAEGAPQPTRQMENAFTQFYTTNKWGNKESKSGAGSTLAYTANIREKLPILVREHGIRSMFDAPCGDFNWMKEVKFDDGFSYMGGDIVADLIGHTSEKYSSPTRSFMRFDVVTDEFPKVDMWFCRDLLFHLPFKLGLAALENFAKSQIKFAMITTHVNSGTFVNRDTDRPGPFRLMDLFSPPFNFPLPLARVKDYVAPYPPREMCLWTREQVIAALGERP